MGDGSINKLTLLLQEKNVTYGISTIDKLRTLHDIRSKIYPAETGFSTIRRKSVVIWVFMDLGKVRLHFAM
jgi:hypothetical protein